MKHLADKLSLSTEIFDTLMLCASYIFLALVGDAWPFRVFICFCFTMAIIELAISHKQRNRKMPPTTLRGFYATGFVVILSAMICIVCPLKDPRSYILWIGVATASDASGLAFGRLFKSGHPKLTQEISPNKTYFGYLGEIIGTNLTGWVILGFFGLPPTLPNVVYITFAWLPCAAGDLLGSMAKRELNIKDSNQCLFNHPILSKIEILMRSRHGFLDCFDSASLAFIVFVILQGRL